MVVRGTRVEISIKFLAWCVLLMLSLRQSFCAEVRGAYQLMDIPTIRVQRSSSDPLRKVCWPLHGTLYSIAGSTCWPSRESGILLRA